MDSSWIWKISFVLIMANPGTAIILLLSSDAGVVQLGKNVTDRELLHIKLPKQL